MLDPQLTAAGGAAEAFDLAVRAQGGGDE
jgi:hypothetical protein